MSTRLLDRFADTILGTFGLFLVVLVGRLVPHVAPLQPTYAGRARAWLARRALDGIAAIGWVFDRLPPHVIRTKMEPPLPRRRVGARPARSV
jgi:hypothetical protein